jgi:hypothetical protein
MSGPRSKHLGKLRAPAMLQFKPHFRSGTLGAARYETRRRHGNADHCRCGRRTTKSLVCGEVGGACQHHIRLTETVAAHVLRPQGVHSSDGGVSVVLVVSVQQGADREVTKKIGALLGRCRSRCARRAAGLCRRREVGVAGAFAILPEGTGVCVGNCS